jgi:hypothetical protein
LAAVLFIPIYVLMARFSNPLNPAAMTGLIFIQVLLVTMVYGPIAAFLVESFPARSRYISLSIPYHLGNGIFGGLIPVLAANVTLGTNNRYTGLIFPVTVAFVTAVIGALFLKETSRHRIWAEGTKSPSSQHPAAHPGTGPHAARPGTGPHTRPPSGVHAVPPQSEAPTT